MGAGVALPEPLPSLPPSPGLEEGPGNRAPQDVGSSFVDSAICVARPGADGRACSPQGHTCTSTCVRAWTHARCAGCDIPPPRPPGTCQGLPGAGGPGVRRGKDWTGLRACLGQSFQLWLLRGGIWLGEQMGVPSAILLEQAPARHAGPGKHKPPCAGET